MVQTAVAMKFGVHPTTVIVGGNVSVRGKR